MNSIFNTAIFLVFGLLIFCTSCTNNRTHSPLPVLGETEIIEKLIDGKTKYDTIPHTIPDFAFVNQDSQWVTPESFENKIYVADFFFTSCPTICPKMKAQLLRIYEIFHTNPEVSLLSHSIDPRHDTVAVLKKYAERLGVKAPAWHFVTGHKTDIYAIAREYMATAEEDERAPGGFIHSGSFLLIDKHKRIRGNYDGTDAKKVDELIQDMKILLDEE